MGRIADRLDMGGDAAVCLLAFLRRHRQGEVHLQAAWIFSATDIQANIGVIAAGALVGYTRSAIPDLVIGLDDRCRR